MPLASSAEKRRNIELANAVRAPTAFVLEKYLTDGMDDSDNSIVLPNVASATPRRTGTLRQAGYARDHGSNRLFRFKRVRLVALRNLSMSKVGEKVGE